LRFSPNALAFSSSSDIYATAGSKAEIFVGSLPTPAAPETWSSQFHVPGRTISNAVLWAPLPYAPDDDHSNKLERLVISNNDETVKMFNVDTSPRRNSESRIEVAGDIRIGTPVNHGEPLDTRPFYGSYSPKLLYPRMDEHCYLWEMPHSSIFMHCRPTLATSPSPPCIRFQPRPTVTNLTPHTKDYSPLPSHLALECLLLGHKTVL